ncbi:MAG TPA: DEAD/DEAH box helicase, partial [Gemmatimonadaceae bacterium]|nr:DEAD/DEAH box helicase [Gemmatimonadaceae bacterium]
MRAALASHRAAVVVAPPGTGKTTRVPPAVADAGRVVVLQPRRVAARSVARRIADEQGWTLGREVGWHVRFDRRFSADTRVLIVTEGMLTHYLHEDPLLTDVSTVVLDEFHERSLHTDLGLALVAEAW